MSCEHKDGMEVVYCGQPLEGGSFRMVRLIVNHINPTGFYRKLRFKEDMGGRLHGQPEAVLVPVELVTQEGGPFSFSDEKDQLSMIEHWERVYEPAVVEQPSPEERKFLEKYD